MKTSLLILLLAFLVVPLAAQEAPVGSLLVLRNVNVVDVVEGTVQPSASLLIEGNRIMAIGDVEIPSDAQVIDASGKYVIPGLWDMHAHLVWGDWNLSDLLVAHGVTGVRDMWGSLEQAEALRMAAAAGQPMPRMIMAGNLVDGTPLFWPDASIAGTPEMGRAVVDSLADAGAPFVKVYDSLAPEVYDAIVTRAAERGLRVAGHVPMRVRAAHASDAGQRSIEHVFGVLPGCSTAEDSLLAGSEAMLRLMAEGSMPAALQAWLGGMKQMTETYDETRCRALAEQLARNETWVVPTLVTLRGTWMRNDSTFRSDSRLKYIPPEMRDSWLPENSFPARLYRDQDWRTGQAMYRLAVEVVGLLEGEGVPLLAGSDAVVPYVFAGSGLHDELELLVEAGLSTVQALRTATINPARFLQRSDELGTVEEGKLADLVLLDANPLEDITNIMNIYGVILDGTFMSRSDLDAILAETEGFFIDAGE